MLNNEAILTLSKLSARSLGVFHGAAAVAHGISRKQLAALKAIGIIERELPDVYRMSVVARSNEQRLRAALLWAGQRAVGSGLSAGETFGLQGVHTRRPEITVPATNAMRSKRVVVHRSADPAPLMVRRHRGLRVTGVEATLVALGHALDAEAFEVACEDARRRRLTGVPALRTYLERFGRKGLPGLHATRALLDELDPVHPARSTLEVKTRRLLVANRITGFTREFPLEWNGRVRRFDFCVSSHTHDHRDERPPLARRPDRLRVRRRQVERPRPTRVPPRARDLGQGRPQSRSVARRTGGNARRVNQLF